MSEYNSDIVKAAEYLDGYAEKGTFSWLPVTWRNEIDVDTIDMDSTKKCILGQLHGDYSAASDLLWDEDRDAWNEVRRTFANCTSEWVEYIKGTHSNLRVDSQWSHAFGRDATIKALVEIDGAKHVVYAVNDSGSIWVKSEADFLDGRTEIVKLDLKKGDEVKFKNYTGSAMFYWCSDDLVIRVDGSDLGHSSLWYYTELYGTAHKGTRSEAIRFEKITNG